MEMVFVNVEINIQVKTSFLFIIHVLKLHIDGGISSRYYQSSFVRCKAIKYTGTTPILP